MVGYRKHDTLTAQQKFIAGCVSGCVTRFVTQPMDVIKVKIQLQKKGGKKTLNTFQLLSHIWKEEGMKAFFHGHNLGQVHSIMSISTQFYLYELTTRTVFHHPLYKKKYKPLAIFVCGTLSGCASTALVLPLEVIRVRQILVKKQYGGLIKGAKTVYASGGILSFYEGLTASLLQMGPQIGIAFTVFSYVQRWILRNFSKCSKANSCDHTASNAYEPEEVMVSSALAGWISGFISKTMTYPFDLVKRRLQIATHQTTTNDNTPSTSKDLIRCRNLIQCLKKTYSVDGFLGLYRGWTVTIIKTQVTSVVAFTSYELTCYFIRDMYKSK